MTTDETRAPVWLIGLMGCGKTTVGRALAAETGRPYLDNDALIAARAGHTTEELARRGGPELHLQEAAYVRNLVATRPDAVAGIPASAADQPELLHLLRDSGLLVYLHCRPQTLAVRVSQDAPRPWLSTSPADIEEMLTGMYARRDEPLRSAAHLTLDGEATVGDLVPRVLAADARP